jgi:uncharacterized protein (UPF0248 family)
LEENWRDQILAEFEPEGRHPKPILNEIKWRGLDMDKCEIDVLHRGAPKDRITIRGSDISLGRSFFTYGETMIPYHRILRIRYDGRTVFVRAPR